MSKKVLVICGDQYHSGDHVMAGLSASVDEQFDLIQASDGPILEFSDSYSAIVLAKLNVSSPSDTTPWASEISGKALCEFVSRGSGLLVVHAGTVGYSIAPGIDELTGGSFIQHPSACDVTIEPVADHHLTKDTIAFTIHDEHYFVEHTDQGEVFLLTRSEHGVQPGGWTRTFGRGRVCVLTPGHFESVWSHPQFHSLVRNGLGWITHG